MSSKSENNGDGEHGVEHLKVPTMTITVDPRTGMPSYKCTELPVAFWQMMVGEVARQLEETRRIGAAMQMQAQLREQAANQAVADALRKSR